MSILKNLKKKQKPASVASVVQVVANVQTLIEKGLITADPDSHRFSFYSELWTGRNQKFKENFCKSLLTWRKTIHLQQYQDKPGLDKQALQLFNIESNKKLAEYSPLTGFKEFMN